MLFIYYQAYQIEIHTKTKLIHWKNESTIREYQRRLDSISNGESEKNKISGISDKYSMKEEEEILNEIIQINKNRNQKIEKELENEPIDLVGILERIKFQWILCISAAFALIITYIGYRNWYIKHQKVSDAILALEKELKEKELKQENAPTENPASG